MSAVKELAVWLAAYGVLFPALQEMREPKEALEIEAGLFAGKVRRLVVGNIRSGAPDPGKYAGIAGWDLIREQYEKDGVHPTPVLAEAHALATLAITGGDEGTINNVTTAMSIPAAWIDAGMRFRRFPLLSKRQMAEYVDLAWQHVEKERVRRSMDVAEAIVVRIAQA